MKSSSKLLEYKWSKITKLLFSYSSKDGGVSQQQVCWDQLLWWHKVQNKVQGNRMCKCEVCMLLLFVFEGNKFLRTFAVLKTLQNVGSASWNSTIVIILSLYVSRCWMLEGGLYKGVKLTHCWQMSKMLFPPFFGPIWFCERKKDTHEYTIH